LRDAGEFEKRAQRCRKGAEDVQPRDRRPTSLAVPVRESSSAFCEPWPDLTLEECASAIEDLRRQWKELLDKLTPEKLAGELTYKTTKGIEHRTPVGDILMHLVLHSAYHRGQVAAAVREAGGKPAPTDYVVYVRTGKR